MTLQHTRRLTAGLVLVCSLLIGGALMLSPQPVLADEATTIISTGLDNAATGTFNKEVSAATFVGNLIQVLLSATGLIFLILTVYAGILYMTAAGDEGKVRKAKSILTTSLIGIIIIVGAYALTVYVIDALATASSPTGT